MDCTNCELSKVKFYCQNCLRNHLREYRTALQHVGSEKNSHVEKAKKALEVMSPAREKRAGKAATEQELSRLQNELQRLRTTNEKAQARLASLTEELSHRRQNLRRAKEIVPTMPTTDTVGFHASIDAFQRASVDMSLSLARARAGLVQELVEVFDIVEVGGRPSLGAKPGVKGEWNIVGSILPVPGDIRRHPPDRINATVQHTLHFLSLLTYYLGVKLPFEVSWSGGLPNTGYPSISAGRGSDHGGWAKWTERYELRLTHPNSGSSSSQQAKDKESQSQSFIIAFTMLLYNVAYLAHTQGVEVALSQSGEILRNLWAVCCSGELGKRSHGARTHSLPFPTPPNFSLDFTQLLQATSAKPSTRPRHGHVKPTGKAPPKEETILEEDGEWDFVEYRG